MTVLRGVRPRCACEAGSSPTPEYASTSVSRTVTPYALTRHPSSDRAADSTSVPLRKRHLLLGRPSWETATSLLGAHAVAARRPPRTGTHGYMSSDATIYQAPITRTSRRGRAPVTAGTDHANRNCGGPRSRPPARL